MAVAAATMTLFAALTAKDGDASSSSSSSSPPEAIQLHSDRVLDFLNGAAFRLKMKSASSKSGGEQKERSAAAANATSAEGGQSRYFSALGYQAIQTQQDDGPLPNKAGAGAVSTAQRHSRPDLGVWDCRVDNRGAEAAALLLKRVVLGKKKQQAKEKVAAKGDGEEKKGEEMADAGDRHEISSSDGPSPPVVMAVDISNPAEVQPVVEQMRSVLLEVYDSDEKAAPNINPRQTQCTTSINALKSSVFGKTLNQKAVKADSPSPSEQNIALILAVIVSSTTNAAASTSAAEEFVEKQARALLLYHLHKFCLEVDCTLCFVSDRPTSAADVVVGEGDGKEAASTDNDPLLGRNTAMSIDELGKVIRRVAMGLTPVEHNDTTDSAEGKDEAKEEGKKGARPPSLHAPGSHDADLIHGAYLRNASCEGRWDAGKDDLQVALSPPSKTSKTKSKDGKAATGGGDEEWLSQLASSIGLSPEAVGEALTPSAADREDRRKQLKKGQLVKKRPAQKRKSVAARGKDSKPKDEKEVMNFFDNLLKK